MAETSNTLGLPFILPAQAQKHVTHNAALSILDAVVQLSVQSMTDPVPPASPAAGARHILPASAGGAWAGQEAGTLAVWDGLAWVFYAPVLGWRAWVEDTSEEVVFDGTEWRVPSVELTEADLQNLVSLGVATTADATNRLAVASDASLFTHAGAGHQLKVNKAAAADTASLLFQSGWTGHAEMGLAGNTDLSIKVSADGTSFTEALRADAASGQVSLPQGVDFGGTTLSHYEEGSFTPQLSFGGSSAGISYTVQSGNYVRVGKIVLLQCAITLNARGTGTGDAEITGLPYDADPDYYPGDLFFIGGGASLSEPGCRILPGKKIVLTGGVPTGASPLQHFNFTDTSNFKVSILHTL